MPCVYTVCDVWLSVCRDDSCSNTTSHPRSSPLGIAPRGSGSLSGKSLLGLRERGKAEKRPDRYLFFHRQPC